MKILWLVLRWLAGFCAVVVVVFVVIPYLFLYSIAWQNVAKRQEHAAQGYHDDQYTLGEWHRTGEVESRLMGIVRQDDKKALYWLGRAASGGYARAYAPYAAALEKNGQKAAANEWRTKARLAEKRTR